MLTRRTLLAAGAAAPVAALAAPAFAKPPRWFSNALVIDGLSGDQRFYYGWAQVWRTKFREPALRQQLIATTRTAGQP